MAQPWPIPADQNLTTSQIAALRSCPDFGNVFRFITRSWGPDNAGRPISMSIDDHINTVWWVWTHWDPFQADFHRDYRDYNDYMAKKCGGGGTSAQGGTSVQQVTSGGNANIIAPAALTNTTDTMTTVAHGLGTSAWIAIAAVVLLILVRR